MLDHRRIPSARSLQQNAGPPSTAYNIEATRTILEPLKHSKNASFYDSLGAELACSISPLQHAAMHAHTRAQAEPVGRSWRKT
jgi:hypothetical protein